MYLFFLGYVTGKYITGSRLMAAKTAMERN